LCGVAANQHGRCTRDGNFAVAHPHYQQIIDVDVSSGVR